MHFTIGFLTGITVCALTLLFASQRVLTRLLAQ